MGGGSQGAPGHPYLAPSADEGLRVPGHGQLLSSMVVARVGGGGGKYFFATLVSLFSILVGLRREENENACGQGELGGWQRELSLTSI